MQFEINGQSYFLNYVPAEGWMLFAPTPRGVRVLPIINDDEVEVFRHLLLDEEQDETKPTN